MAEIAGLVLGAIPLLISALEHHEKLVKPAVAFVRWRGQLPNFTRRLWMGHTAYEQNVRLLLMQAMSSEDIDRIMGDPHSDDWKDEWLVKELQEKLGHAYQPAMSTIKEIADIMGSVATALNIDGADKITQHGLEAIVLANPPVQTGVGWSKYEFRKRVVFTLKRRSVEEKLRQLDECNQRLAGFLEKAAKLHDHGPDIDTCSPRLRIRFAAPLETIRHGVSRVHRVLARSWCQAHRVHEAGLLLEQRLVRRRRTNCTRRQPSAAGSVSCFGVCILLEPVPTWYDTEISLDDETGCGVENAPRKIPRVTFSVPIASEAVVPTKSVAVLAQQRVSNICSTIQAATYPVMGFSLDSSDTLRGCVQVRRTTYQLPVADSVSLSDFLPRLRRDVLSYPDFYALAITLVCSMLHLGGTPWLRQPWSSYDIRFPCRGGIGNESVDVQHPYLTRKYPSVLQQQTEPQENAQLTDQLNLLALAVMLLELNVGTSIGVSDGRDENTAILDLLTAQNLLRVHTNQGRLSCAFASAITYCLQAYLDPTASFSNPDYVKTVEQRVLEPLEREMQVVVYGS